MVRIVKTEFYKLKRYHILWAGVALMLLSRPADLVYLYGE